jgi:hypothetical protein
VEELSLGVCWHSLSIVARLARRFSDNMKVQDQQRRPSSTSSIFCYDRSYSKRTQLRHSEILNLQPHNLSASILIVRIDHLVYRGRDPTPSRALFHFRKQHSSLQHSLPIRCNQTVRPSSRLRILQHGFLNGRHPELCPRSTDHGRAK